MKIVQINSVYGTGSTGKIVRDIHEKLDSLNYNSYVIYGRGKKINDRGVIKINCKIGNYLDGLLSRIFDNQGRNSYFATKKAVKVLKKIKPDIVHFHNLHGYYINYEMLFQFLVINNIKTIITMHDCWLFTGHCTHYDYIRCDKWITKCCNCPQIKKYPKAFIDNSTKNFLLKKELLIKFNKLAFVTPSEWLKNETAKSFLKDKKSYKFLTVLIQKYFIIEM